jgi:hypothetical protein
MATQQQSSRRRVSDLCNVELTNVARKPVYLVAVWLQEGISSLSLEKRKHTKKQKGLVKCMSEVFTDPTNSWNTTNGLNTFV